MATVAQVIKAALQRILVQGSEAPLESDEYQDAIFALNNFMSALEAEGVDLGYTEVNDLSDEVTVPAGALRGIIANVAIEVAPDYGGVVSPELIQQAASGMKAMRHLGQTIKASCFPCTLPIGSGNYQTGYSPFYGNHSYGCGCSSCLATEADACILMEGA